VTDAAEDREAEERFRGIADGVLADPGVRPGTGFGAASGLRVDGKIFAMLIRGALVVKLPRDRVDALVAAGTGTRFEPGTGRVLWEWVAIPPASVSAWASLIDEALTFVRAVARRPGRR
jgi:hypothetical protein